MVGHDLRYLSLTDSSIKSLPSSLADLTCLQTLDFRGSYCEGSATNIGQMKHLRHLYFPSYYKFNRQDVSDLSNLQTLQIASADIDWTQLGKLTSLRKLTIGLSTLFGNIEQSLPITSNTLNRLQSLWVYNRRKIQYSTNVMQAVRSCRHIYKLRLDQLTVELPQDPQYYPNLTKLHLRACSFNENQVAVMEKMPNLTKVILKWVHFEGNIESTLVFSKGGFPRLRVLSLSSVNVDDWKVEEGSMPNLCELSIDSWWELRRLPEGLRHITTLQKITLTGMRRTDCTRLQKGGEDFYKFQHVPSLIFENIKDA